MTLARLQQLVTSGLLTVALVWAALAWHAGHPAWALVGALLLIFGYALVLAVEFIFLSCASKTDPGPRPAPLQLISAWLGEVLAAPQVFCWQQPFRSHACPDNLRKDPEGRRGVLLVHGFVCNRGIWNHWMQRLCKLGVVHVAVNLEPIFGSIDEYRSTIEQAVTRLEQCTGLAPVVVAHSMGGLAFRAWCRDSENANRFHHAITIATPHQGTWLARFALTPNARQMQRHSKWLTELARQEPATLAARCTCFYGNCDNIVFPPRVATLPGADNRHLAGVAHVHMVSHPDPFDEMLQHLRPLRPDRAGAPNSPQQVR